MKKSNSSKFIIFVILFILFCIYSMSKNSNVKDFFQDDSSEKFRIISSSENEDLENIILEYAEKEGIDVQIDYAGTLDIMEKLNSGEKYDAVWASNSIWLYMLNSDIKTNR